MAIAAKEGNPDCVLYVNDYDILVEGCVNADKYIAQIEDLLAKGVPIGGIGCQAHTISASAPDEDGRSRKTDPETFQTNLDRLAEFNLPIKLTETLFDGANEQETAEQLRKYFRISFAHPNVEAIVLWGFWAGSHWQPQTAMWLRDWTPTAQVEAYRNLVFKEWWTQVTAKADETGQFKTNAFYGDYIITSNGETKNVTLSKKDKLIEVKF
jgi:GH35 family endo-1,4-beta-xylanase